MYSKKLIVFCILLSIFSCILSIISVTIIYPSKVNSLGFSNSQNVDLNTTSLVGTYRGKYNQTNRSNYDNDDYVIVLFEDFTMIHPSGVRGTWYVENGDVVLQYESYNYNEKGEKQPIIAHDKATIVYKGLLFGPHFFEKM